MMNGCCLMYQSNFMSKNYADIDECMNGTADSGSYRINTFYGIPLQLLQWIREHWNISGHNCGLSDGTFTYSCQTYYTYVGTYTRYNMC